MSRLFLTLIVAPLLGASFFLCAFAVPAIIQLSAAVRFARARGAGEQHLADVNWWFTDRIAAWTVGNQAPVPGSIPAPALESGAPVFSIAPVPRVLSGLASETTFGSFGVLASVILGLCGLGAIAGGCLGCIQVYRSARILPGRRTTGKLFASLVGVIGSGCLLSGWAGALGWYLDFDRSCARRGPDKVFEMGTLAIAGLLPIAGWCVVVAWVRLRRLLQEDLRAQGRCHRCGYPLNAGGSGTCPECGPGTAREAGPRVWPALAVPAVVVVSLIVTGAMLEHGASWRGDMRWLALRSEFLPNRLIAFMGGDRPRALTIGGDSVEIDARSRGPAQEPRICVFDAQGRTVVDWDAKAQGPMSATFRLGGAEVNVRGPWLGADGAQQIFQLDLGERPSRFEPNADRRPPMNTPRTTRSGT